MNINSEYDCKLSFVLSKLFIPGFESDNYIIDISYDGENYRLKYPMTEAFVIPLKNIFDSDRNTLNLVVMTKQAQKYKKIAKGEINIYKKYFINLKLNIEKFIHLELYKSQIDKMSIGSTLINAMSVMGKIFLKAALIDPDLNESKTNNLNNNSNKQLDNKKINNYLAKDKSISIFTKSTGLKNTQILRNNIKNYLLKKNKISSTKTERFGSLIIKEKEFLNKLKKDRFNESYICNNKDNNNNTDKKSINDKNHDESFEDIPIDEKQFNDNLSDVSVSVIEGLENDCIKIEEVNNDMNDFINKIKLLFDEKFEEILPSNNEELKLYINKVAKQIQLISESYISNLDQLNEINSKIKHQAKIYYEKYKEKKREFKRERKELKRKNQQLEEEINSNIEDNKKVKNKYNDFSNELCYFKSLIGIKEENNKPDEDIVTMVEILNSVKEVVDINAGLNDNQIFALNQIFTKYKESDIEDDESLLSSLIIEKIEEVVNDLFKKDKIINIEIKQNSRNEYEFNNISIKLRLTDDNLFVEDEDLPIEKWLINNFSTDTNK